MFLLGIQQPTAALTITKQRIELQTYWLTVVDTGYDSYAGAKIPHGPAKINLTESATAASVIICPYFCALALYLRLWSACRARIHLLALQFRITVAVFTVKELISVVPMELIILLIIVAVLAFGIYLQPSSGVKEPPRKRLLADRSAIEAPIRFDPKFG